MLKSKKNVFWEALLVTILIFVFGIFLGIGFEKRNVSIVENYYAQSEVSMMDMFVLQNIIDSGSYQCEDLVEANIEFADKIYEEAVLLEPYEESNILTKEIIVSHQKYDLLRAFVLVNSLRVSKKCSANFVPVAYLYEYNTKEIKTKATQKVWSRILADVKQKYGSKIILIPIAVDNNLSSVNVIVSKFNIEKFPAVVIGEEIILNELTSVKDIETYLDYPDIIKLN